MYAIRSYYPEQRYKGNGLVLHATAPFELSMPILLSGKRVRAEQQRKYLHGMCGIRCERFNCFEFFGVNIMYQTKAIGGCAFEILVVNGVVGYGQTNIVIHNGVDVQKG